MYIILVLFTVSGIALLHVQSAIYIANFDKRILSVVRIITDTEFY